jgi:hypothetical protein
MPSCVRHCRRLTRSYTVCVIFTIANLVVGGCDGCAGGHRGSVSMCGTCVRTVDCAAGLTCINGVCETAPPSCHVQIGL